MTLWAFHPNIGVRNLAGLWRLGLRALLILAFLVAGGGFSLQLSGLDTRAAVGADSASMRSEIATGLAFLLLLGCGLTGWRRIGALIRSNAVLVALPVLAMASCLWAPQPELALRRAVAFLATVLSGLTLVACMPGFSALKFVAQAAATGVALSIAYVMAAPAYGLHQFTDGVQSVHAGAWRGLFVHRTVLGQLAALSLAMAVYGGADAFGRISVRLIVILASCLCLVMAHSAGGWFSASILLAVPWALRIAQRWARRAWVAGLGLALGVLFLAATFTPVLATSILHVLGKDATLTGRTDLWRLMLQAAARRPLLGYGYSTGFRDAVASFISTHSAFGYVPNAQNGYLDAVLNLGLAGLGLALIGLGLGARRAVRLALQATPPVGLAVLPLLIVVFMIELNGIEAELISANDIFMLIYATAFAASGDLRSISQATAVKAR